MIATESSLYLTTYGVQWATCILFGGVVFSMWKVYHRSYFIYIYLSWLALSFVYLGTGAALYAIDQGLPAGSWQRISAASISLVASYSQVALLLAGVYELASGRRFRMVILIPAVAALLLIGLISPWLYINDSGAWISRYFVRFGARCLATGTTFLLGGIILWRIRRPKGLGAKLVATGFVLYGAQNLQFFGVSVVTLVTGQLPNYSRFLSFIEFFLLVMIGIGTVLWLFEAERKRVVMATQEIELLSNFDPLTGLPNRNRFINSFRLELPSLRDSADAALLVIDIDNFKALNDSLGRASGDEILRVLAERLSSFMHNSPLLARIGSDEFGLLIDDVSRLGNLHLALESLLAIARKPVNILGQEIFVTASIGAALIPQHGRSIIGLLAKAEAALHGGQKQGRDSARLYDASVHSLVSDRLRFETRLSRALNERQFFMVYQPIIRLADGRLEGFEALLRWQHPNRGVVAPAEFLGIAADIGLLNRLEWWAVETACQQLKRWIEFGRQDFYMSVNLTPQRFQQDHMAETLTEIIERTEVPARQIQLEITEETAFHQTETAIEVLHNLRQIGFRIAIDDFGTGYASLGHLRHLPVDILKLDRSFTRKLGHDDREDAFVGGIVMLAHSLEIPVVAEGVEKPRELEILQRIGCDSGQGYLFGKPHPAESWQAMDDNWHPLAGFSSDGR